MGKLLSVEGITKEFDGKRVLDKLSLHVNDGEIVALFGPNGCGKTTLLNIISGITSAEEGACRFSEKTAVSYVFQNYRESLMPWKTNYANISLPLELQSIEAGEIGDRIGELKHFFGANIDFSKYPYQMSGGQQQMLAFLRALVNKPSLLLVDEAFSALDFENNLLLRQNLQKYHAQFKPGVLMVTHDIEEAVHLADRIVVLSKQPGRIVEVIDNHKQRKNVEFLASQQFLKTKKRVLTAFLRGQPA